MILSSQLQSHLHHVVATDQNKGAPHVSVIVMLVFADEELQQACPCLEGYEKRRMPAHTHTQMLDTTLM